MNNQGIYIYGFVPDNCIDNVKSLLLESGIYSIEYGDISALVSDTTINKIEYLNRDELAHLLVDHQQKIEKIMNSGCSKIIPMKLGTVVSSGNDVIKIIKNGFNLLNQTFESIDGVEEIDVAVVWSNFADVIAGISEKPQIRHMKESIADKESPDPVDSINIGKMIKEKIDHKNNKVNIDIVNSLMSFCVDLKKHDTMNDEMPVNCAFLVKKENRNQFMEMIDKLDIKYSDKLNFKIVGPLPCYSFYTIESKIIKKDDIEHAKKLLDIDLLNSEYDLKKAYRIKASLTHPDKIIDSKEENADNFIEANNAYKLLLDYSSIINKSPETVLSEPLYLVKIKN